ncbi:hypothetical protein BpHYR1_049909 [Brachionus plicatilis]|uniref:Uncharacterized protein n=1 Tax=Brachionus plicatilis TaxID=10195 RepID=A0A3M7SWN5_BRAPC|nr:hypothetical protein BpHYR1_049909 [Brachionus plicatilis]
MGMLKFIYHGIPYRGNPFLAQTFKENFTQSFLATTAIVFILTMKYTMEKWQRSSPASLAICLHDNIASLTQLVRLSLIFTFLSSYQIFFIQLGSPKF